MPRSCGGLGIHPEQVAEREAIDQKARARADRPQTEAQRRKEEERSERAQARAINDHYARQRKESERVDRSAYMQGEAKGGEIGLSRQVGADDVRKIG